VRSILLVPLLLAGCAGLTAESLQRTDTAQVCYIAVTQPENRTLAEAELKRRNANCQEHTAEVRRMLEDDARMTGTADHHDLWNGRQVVGHGET